MTSLLCFKITGMSVDYMMTYRSSVDSVGENVTNSILVMNTFIRNARQLNDGLKGAQHLQEEMYVLHRIRLLVERSALPLLMTKRISPVAIER